MAKQTTKREWLESTHRLLRSIDYDYIESCSISVVPKRLKKWNEDAYIPRKVSIGPRFKGTREDLLLMEEVKLRCMLSLIHRADKEGEARKSLEKCSDVIWELDEEVRTSYLGDIKLERYELAQIMLLDGCFLLELLISKGLDSQLPSRLIPPGPAAEVLKDEDVLSDLMLLENQIPILVLHKLSQTLFPNVFESHSSSREEQMKREERAPKINNLALSVLGYFPLEFTNLQAPHVLDLVHFFINVTTYETQQEDDHVVVDIIETTQTQQQHVKLKCCALRLLTAGVTINIKPPLEAVTFRSCCSCFSCGTLYRLCKNLFSWVWNILYGMLLRLCSIFLLNSKHFDADHIPEEVELKGLDFSFRFQSGKLEIEQLHITKTTKAKWCNLIAWEHHKKYKHVSDSKTVSDNKFTWAALIFNGLICSEDDVQLLKDKKIIVDHLKMSNEELMKFFRSIAFGVDHKVVDVSSYRQTVDNINNYSKASFIKRMWNIVLTSFTYRQEWLLRFMNRNYNFVATVLSLLTVVQTVYGILAYYFPK